MKIRIEFKYSRQVFCWKKRSIGSALLLSGLRASAFGDIWEKLKLSPITIYLCQKSYSTWCQPLEKKDYTYNPGEENRVTTEKRHAYIIVSFLLLRLCLIPAVMEIQSSMVSDYQVQLGLDQGASQVTRTLSIVQKNCFSALGFAI